MPTTPLVAKKFSNFTPLGVSRVQKIQRYAKGEILKYDAKAKQTSNSALYNIFHSHKANSKIMLDREKNLS